MTLEGEPWFVAADVCRALGLGNSSDVIKRLDEDERTLVSIEGASNGLPVNAVNEPGLYALILEQPQARGQSLQALDYPRGHPQDRRVILSIPPPESGVTIADHPIFK